MYLPILAVRLVLITPGFEEQMHNQHQLRSTHFSSVKRSSAFAFSWNVEEFPNCWLNGEFSMVFFKFSLRRTMLLGSCWDWVIWTYRWSMRWVHHSGSIDSTQFNQLEVLQTTTPPASFRLYSTKEACVCNSEGHPATQTWDKFQNSTQAQNSIHQDSTSWSVPESNPCRHCQSYLLIGWAEYGHRCFVWLCGVWNS